MKSVWREWFEAGHDMRRQGHQWRKDPQEGGCNKCWADILWVLTEKGKNMPLDVDPSVYGRFSFTGVTVDGRQVVHYVSNHEPVTGELLYKSHFASCDPTPVADNRTEEERSL